MKSIWRLSFGKYLGARELEDGAQLPRGYRVAWWLPYSQRAYCLPMPFHWICGSFRAWWIEWTKTAANDPIGDAYAYGRSIGFRDGRDYGEYVTHHRYVAILKGSMK